MRKTLRLLLTVCALLCPALAFGQAGVRYDGLTLSPSGRPLSANVAVCNSPGLTTTAAQVAGNTAILTMSSNPITAGFAANMQVVVSGFTGGDTYFNVGTLTPFSSTVTITAVSATTIAFPLTHANASASTNGSVFQLGNIANGCAPLASIFSDASLAVPITQPGFVSSNVGNFGFFAASGSYQMQFYGPGVNTYLQPLTIQASLTANNAFTGNNTCKSIGTVMKCVDAANLANWAGSDGGAWINACFAAIGTGSGTNGECHVFGNLTATTQITIGARQALIIHGSITHSQPILMSDGAVIDGIIPRGSPGNVTNIGGIIASGNMTSQIRGLTQDGLTEMFTVRNLGIDGGFFTMSVGQIDLRGMNDKTLVTQVELIHRIGPGIFIGNALANSTSNIHVSHIWDAGGNGASAPCLVMQSDGSNAGSITENIFDDFECSGPIGAVGFVIQNLNVGTSPGNTIRNNTFNNSVFQAQSGAATADYVKIDGAWQTIFHNTSFLQGAATTLNGFHVTNNVNNVGNIVTNTTANTGVTNFLKDDLNTVTLAVSGGHTTLPAYGFYNSSSPVAIEPHFFGGGFAGIASTAPSTPIPANTYVCYMDSVGVDLRCSFGNDALTTLIRKSGSFPTAGHAVTWADGLHIQDGGIFPVGLFTAVNVTPVTSNTNTTADQNLMAITITPGALNLTSRTLLVQLAGVYSTPAASTAVLTHKLKLCTVSGCGSGTVITLATWATSALGGIQVTNDPYNCVLNSSTQTAGVSAAFEAHGNLTIDLAALASAAENVFADNNTATVGTIDSTAQLFLQHTIAFSAASASNSATDRQMIADTVD